MSVKKYLPLGLFLLGLSCLVVWTIPESTYADIYSDVRRVMEDVFGIQASASQAAIYPSTDNTTDLGTSTKEYKNGYFDGTLFPDVIDIGEEEHWTASAASAFSPTVSFSVANKRWVTLTTDANQTGFAPTGGDTGQVITIVSGSGSNTMRFDDGSSTVLGGSDITLTEGQYDVIHFLCVDGTSNQVWVRLGAADN